MEQNNKNKKRGFQSSTSIMMSFILAFVAIVSIAAYGFGKISFAIPEEAQTTFPDTIVTAAEGTDEYRIAGMTATLPINIHRTTDGNYIYCIESDVDIMEGLTYTKDTEISDKGLLYLFNHLLGTDTTIVDGNGNAVPETAKGWIVQTAIWTYQYEVKADNSYERTLSDATVAAFKAETSLHNGSSIVPIFSTTEPIYSTCKVKNDKLADNGATIMALITKAEKIHNGTEAWDAFSLTISKKTDTISATSDNKYYQTDVITVNGTGGKFLGFKIDTTGLPEGSKILNTNGEEMKGDALDNLVTGTQFVLRVPIDKITEKTKNVSLSVTGAFEGDVAYRYVSGDKQKVAFAGKVTKHINKGIDFTFDYTPDVPDTSITTAQSIYFIGLIILLAGVGIIYANIKPKKAEE